MRKPRLGDSLEERHLLFLRLVFGVVCLFLFLAYLAGSVDELLNHNRPSRAMVMAFLTVCFLGSTAAMACWDRTQRIVRSLAFGGGMRLPILISLIVGGICGSLVLVWSPTGWDEGAHILSGMAMRGYSVPYAAHRSPVAQLLAAIFYPRIELINPILFASLVFILWRLLKRNSHTLWLPGFILYAVFHEAFAGSLLFYMGELPAAVFLLLAFCMLSRGKVAWASVAIALAVLSRWNLAPFALSMVAFLAIRVSLSKALLMVCIGGVFFGLWTGATYLLVGSPLSVLSGYASNAEAWSASEDLARPNLVSRSSYYLSNWLFIGLPAVVAICLGPLCPRRPRRDINTEVFRYCIPLSILAYALFTFGFGAHFSRFYAPVIPLGFLATTELLGELWRRRLIGTQALLIGAIAIVPMMAARHASDGTTLASALKKATYQPPVPLQLSSLIDAELPGDQILFAPAIEGLSMHNGHMLMIHLKRTVRFPTAERTSTGSIIPGDTADQIMELLKVVSPGDALLLPTVPVTESLQLERVLETNGWMICVAPDDPEK